MPTYPVDFQNKKQLGDVFRWQTRMRLAPKYGTCPISHYQSSHVKVIEEVEKRLKGTAERQYPGQTVIWKVFAEKGDIWAQGSRLDGLLIRRDHKIWWIANISFLQDNL